MPEATDQRPETPAPIPAYRSHQAIALFLLCFVAALATDLGLKAWSFAAFDLHAPPSIVIPKVLALKLTENQGAVFGMWQGQRAVFIVASVTALGVIGWLFGTSRASERWFHIALALILGGAMGNLYDRMVFGAVRDMLLLFPGVRLPWGLNWPDGSPEVYPWIFNPADVFLLAGIGLMVVRSLVHERSAKDTATPTG